MTTKITELTQEQKDLMPVWAEKWIRHGLSTEPADWETAEENIIKCYKFANLTPPPHFVRAASPLQGVLLAGILDTLDTFDLGKAFECLKTPTKQQVNLAKKYLDAYIGGSLWVGYTARTSFFIEACGLELSSDMNERFAAQANISKSIGWWIPTTNFCIMCDRPKHIDIENKVLHSVSRLAIQWRDGWGIASWRGTTIPNNWILKSPPPAKEILRWPDIEQRRAACEIVGWANILKQLKAVTIDKHSNPEIGELIEVNLPNSGPERFLRVRCGTGREFALPVPPEMTSALQANLWTYDMEPDETLLPEIRT